MKKLFLILLILFLVGFVSACSDSQRPRFVVTAGQASGDLVIDNNDYYDAEIYLDGSFVGFVSSGRTKRFQISPGLYELSVNFIGDGVGLSNYAQVRVRDGRTTTVGIETSLLGFLISIIFE